MPDLLTPIISFAKQATPVLAAVALSCTFAIFASDGLLVQMGLLEVRDNYRSMLGTLLLFSVSILTTRILFGVGAFFQRRFIWWKNEKRLRKNLENLQPDEKAYLVPYIEYGKVSQKFLEEDGIRGSLVAKKIIYRAANLGDIVDGFDYVLQPWARQYLQKKPQLLNGYTENIQTGRNWMY